MNQTIEQSYDVSPERFWDVFLFDEAYSRALYEHLKLNVQKREVERGERVRRVVHMMPERNVPRLVDKLLMGASLVKERGEYDPDRQRMTIEIELPVVGSRVRFGGTYSSVSGGSGGFRLVWQTYCEARIPLVGGRLERYLLDEVKQSFADQYVFTKRWLAEHVAS